MTVLVTGATGTVGAHLTRLLVEQDLPVRTLSRSAGRLKEGFGSKVESVLTDLDDPFDLHESVAGTETLVLITAAGPNAAKQASAVLTAAKHEGVRKVVRVSAIKAAPEGPTENSRLHAQTESEIIASGMEYVLLRPNCFMQNMFLAAEPIARKHTFSFATGHARMGMIDARDIAQCAFASVISEDWNGKTLELTGPETLGFADVAKCLSRLMDIPIRYEPISPKVAFDIVESAGWGSWMAALTRDYGAAYGAGWGDFTTEHVFRLTGTAPRNFETFALEVFVPALRRIGLA
ncbi:MAG: NAD(P)H-binding protein [Roseibium sp.]|uniref:NAD(P)H-binding protein n=1 Tax=Roseibium sp. TaxID=1936156 RepID=UPI00262BD5FA|nr:NAD(P)H-binding protein [Roseibium sp.]MCV0424950.1 NAD(P)H-binding protein [Roseibium sp.]